MDKNPDQSKGPSTRRYSVSVSQLDGDRTTGQTVEGEAVPVAAWLRAIADQLDPPRGLVRHRRDRTFVELAGTDATRGGQ